MAKKIKAVSQNKSGRNTKFKVGKATMKTQRLVKPIENGNHPNHHIRLINGIKTPVSNPDKSSKNNLE